MMYSIFSWMYSIWCRTCSDWITVDIITPCLKHTYYFTIYHSAIRKNAKQFLVVERELFALHVNTIVGVLLKTWRAVVLEVLMCGASTVLKIGHSDIQCLKSNIWGVDLSRYLNREVNCAGNIVITVSGIVDEPDIDLLGLEYSEVSGRRF